MIKLLERILDALCKATGRDVFLLYPDGTNEKIDYLKKEIITTLELIEKGVIK